MPVKGDMTMFSMKSLFKEKKYDNIIYVDDRTYNLLKSDYLDDQGKLINTGLFLDGYKVRKYRRP